MKLIWNIFVILFKLFFCLVVICGIGSAVGDDLAAGDPTMKITIATTIIFVIVGLILKLIENGLVKLFKISTPSANS